MARLFILLGPSGSGKDTAAGVLDGIIGGLVNFKFAEPYKQAVASIYGLERWQLEDRAFRETMGPAGKTWGDHLAEGAKHFRAWDPDVMLHQARKKLDHIMAHKVNVAFTDLRFPNEVGLVKSYLHHFCDCQAIYLLREGAKFTSADTHLREIFRSLALLDRISPSIVYNRDLDQLESTLERLTASSYE